jgi:hypothetical protein
VPACGEGYSGQNWRSRISPVREIECMTFIESSNVSIPHALYSPEVNTTINGREMPDNGVLGVGHAP